MRASSMFGSSSAWSHAAMLGAAASGATRSGMARTVAQRRPDALTAELDPDALGGAHELAARVDELQLLRRLLDRPRHEVAVLDRGDVAELALGDHLDRLDAELGGELAVERARRAAALDVAEHGQADVVIGLGADRVGEALAGTAELLLPGRVAGHRDRELPAPGLRALGDDAHRVG